MSPVSRSRGAARRRTARRRAAGDDEAAQRLYTGMAGRGWSWEYICPQDLPRVSDGTVYIPGQAKLSLNTCRALAALPHRVQIVLAEPDALRDEYGRPLPEALASAIALRTKAGCGMDLIALPSDRRLGKPYNESAEAFYLSWSEKRGHFRYPLAYTRLEARRVQDGDDWLVAVVNHVLDGEPVKARLPWLGAPYKVVELTAQGAPVPPDDEQAFAPLDVRLFRYVRK